MNGDDVLPPPKGHIWRSGGRWQFALDGAPLGAHQVEFVYTEDQVRAAIAADRSRRASSDPWTPKTLEQLAVAGRLVMVRLYAKCLARAMDTLPGWTLRVDHLATPVTLLQDPGPRYVHEVRVFATTDGVSVIEVTAEPLPAAMLEPRAGDPA